MAQRASRPVGIVELALLAVASAGCQTEGTIPIGPLPSVRTTWLGVTTSLNTGPLALTLVVDERTDGTATGTFTMGGGRSGTLVGRVDGSTVALNLTQTQPCQPSTYSFHGTLMNANRELSGLWSGRECDTRQALGAFATVKSGERSAARAIVGGSWRVSYRAGPTVEGGIMDLFQSADGLVTGIFANSAQVFAGRIVGVVSGDSLSFVLERDLPCRVSRSTMVLSSNVAGNGDSRNLDGSWSGPDCIGTMVTAGTFEGRR